MTTGSGLGDKPPPRDSDKDGGLLIGERLCRLPPKLCFTFRLISKLQGSVRDFRAVSLERKPHLARNANPILAVKTR